MKRIAVPTAVGLAVGLLVGTGWAVTRDPAPTPHPLGHERPAETRPVDPGPAEPQGDALLVAWTAAPIGDDATERLRAEPAFASVAAVRREEVPVTSVVDGGTTRLVAHEGAHVPVDVVTIDPGAYAALVPPGSRAQVAGLADGEALVGERAARRWRIGPGATVSAKGGSLRVTGVVDDDEIGGAEIAVTTITGHRLGVVRIRYLLVRTADRAAARSALVRSFGDVVRVRATGETPYLRDADAVPPLTAVKDRFGELSVRPSGPDRFEIDPVWVASNIEVDEVPVLGRLACHRAIMPAVVAAMTELEQAGSAWLVDASAPHDCWAPRLIGSAGSADRRLSRHAWGIALDLNPHRNPPGAAPVQAPELVAVLQRHGFTWGGDWLRPEGAYFEFVGGAGT